MARRSPRPPWRDEPLTEGKSPREILKDLSADLCISNAEIDMILTRTDKLRLLHPQMTKGRDMTSLILTSAIQWVRSTDSKRKPVPYSQFVSFCRNKGHYSSKKQILNYVRVYKDAGLYGPGPKVPELLERRWLPLQQKYHLKDS